MPAKKLKPDQIRFLSVHEPKLLARWLRSEQTEALLDTALNAQKPVEQRLAAFAGVVNGKIQEVAAEVDDLSAQVVKNVADVAVLKTDVTALKTAKEVIKP